MAGRLRGTGKVHGDVEGAVQELIEARQLQPRVHYEEIPGTPRDVNGLVEPEVGDLIAWQFRADNTGNGTVVEVLDTNITQNYQHVRRVRVRVLSTGTVKGYSITWADRKVRLT